jgi:hypothetical protein
MLEIGWMNDGQTVLSDHGMQVRSSTLGLRGTIMDDKTLLWNIYQDNRTQAQFHETQRTNGSALIAGGAAVIVASLSQDGQFSGDEISLALILVVLGIFGFLYCLKTSERMQLHLNRCRRFLPILDQMDGSHDIMQIKGECDARTAKQFPFAHRVKLRTFWEGMHILIGLTGLLIVGQITLL